MAIIDTVFFERLFSFIQKNNGIFFEAGANNGIWQSYTYPLEIKYDWTGVLVEPCQLSFNQCVTFRPKSFCLNAALTELSTITELYGDFTDGNLMASVNGERLNRKELVKVPATTLTNIFDTYFTGKKVDLMSIDVENYELQVLKGLDFTKHQPKFILIEIYKNSFEDVFSLLKENNYILVANITEYDDSVNQNDYLFKYNS